MILAYFICKIVFDDKMDLKYCCDNCMYNSVEVRLVLNFEAYNFIAKLGIIYASIKKYSDLFFKNECEKLFAVNLI